MSSTSLIIYRIRAYILPVVILLGCILNILSFFVMRRLHSTTGFYMMVLAFADTGETFFFVNYMITMPKIIALLKFTSKHRYTL